MNITFLFDRCFCRLKWLMRRQNQSIGIIDQCITCDSGLFLISFRKSAIYNQNFSTAFHRIFSIFTLYRHMTVDYMRIFVLKSEFFQYFFHYFFIFQ